MATEDDKKEIQEASDDDDTIAPKTNSADGTAVKEQAVPQHCGSSTDEPPAKESPKKRKQAGSVDLSAAVSSSSSQGSKHRQTMKDLQAERNRIKKEHHEANKKIRIETQRQKRLIDKACRLSNEELLEVFSQRREIKKCSKQRQRQIQRQKLRRRSPEIEMSC